MESELKENNKVNYLKRIKKQDLFLIIVFLVLIIVYVILSVVLNNKYSDIRENNQMIPLHHTFQEFFNSQFEGYSGGQTGAKLKSLMAQLITNANTYYSEPQRIPEVIIKNEESTTYYVERPNNSENLDEEYISDINNIRDALINKKTYMVEFTYFEDLTIDKIIITGELSKDIGN